MVFLFLSALVFDPASMNPQANPCVDFYAYACGGWLKANPIPDDRSTWDVYRKLHEANAEKLRILLTQSKMQRLADGYAACMDEAMVEEKSWERFKPLLADGADVPTRLAALHRAGVNAIFTFYPQQDFRDAKRWVATLDQGGLGLPDRDYYTKNDARMNGIRDKYKTFVETLLTLGGEPRPREAATAVVRVETALAKASMTNVERTDSKNFDHWTTMEALKKAAPNFDWSRYLAATGAPPVAALNLTWPPFMKAVDKVLTTPDDLATYLRYHALLAYAPFLAKRFVDAHFSFFGATLRGVKAQEPRWKRCVRWVDENLGELLGQAFVALHFPPEAKSRVREMVERIQRSMAERITVLPWMNEATKRLALQKLATIQNKIGYPEKWRDYGTLVIRRDDLVGNEQVSAAFEHARQLRKIGTAVERGEWEMTPPTVNAYYNPQLNDMNFPAGILLPPLYDAAGDDAANYGDTGATVGHELTHGFDSDGRQYDAAGNLRDWWTAADDKGFRERAQCLVRQYDQYEPLPGVKISGALTLGENIADLGGTIIALEAWKRAGGKSLEPSGSFTGTQRFFLAYAQSFCANAREEDERLRALTDVHAPQRFRVNGVVANMQEFAQAFGCAAPKSTCAVW